MAEPTPTEYLQALLDRHRAGDPSARDALLQRSLDRLVALARRRFPRDDRLRAVGGTNEVISPLMTRLYKALEETSPNTVLDYARLASMHIQYILDDMAREYPRRAAAPLDESPEPVASGEPADPVVLDEFHAAINKLPDEERQIVDLLYYQELPQAEAAALLGLPLRTFKRRWQQVRLQLEGLLGRGDETK